MQKNTTTFAKTPLADQMVAERFGREYGVKTFAEYLDYVDRRSTVHLDEYMRKRVKDTAGRQRREARFFLGQPAVLEIELPMNDARAGQRVWATLEFNTWLNLIEMGADGAWFLAHKGREHGAGQVRTTAPLGSGLRSANVTVARLIVNAKPGQQARVLDRNPLNLRAANVHLLGNPNTPEGRAGRSKTHTVQFLQDQGEMRRRQAGKNYGAWNDLQAGAECRS